MCFPLGILSTISSEQGGTHFTGRIIQALTKPHRLLNFILNHQARSTQLIEKLDSSRTKVNYMGLNELINMIIIYMTFCLNYYWLLNSVFQIEENLSL